MRYIIQRRDIATHYFVCEYTFREKWGHMWYSLGMPLGIVEPPVVYNKSNTNAPPKLFRSLRVAKCVARQLQKYWGIEHVVMKERNRDQSSDCGPSGSPDHP